MGRVARYKKVNKSLVTKSNGGDYFDTVGVWGLGNIGQKMKKKSQTVLKLQARNKKTKKTTAPASSFFDVAPDHEDDFDLSDLVGSIKKEKIPTLQPPDTVVDGKKLARTLAIPATSTTSTTAQQQQQSNSVATSTSTTPSSTIASNGSTSVTGEETTTTTTTTTKPIRKKDKEEDPEERLFKKLERQVEVQTKEDTAKLAQYARRPDESKRAYNKRVKLETRQIILRTKQQTNNPEKRQRKKEFLASKKKRKMGDSSSSRTDDYDDDNSYHQQQPDDSAGGSMPHTASSVLRGEQSVAARALATQVQFGEQAERPPTFQHLPRGASTTDTKKKSNRIMQLPSLLVHNNSKKKNQDDNNDNDDDVQEQQRAVNAVKRKIEAQYAAIKQRRKQTGDFHL